jgi:hypothetical protein
MLSIRISLTALPSFGALALALFLPLPSPAAEHFAAPGEAGLRFAINEAQAGDTIVLTKSVQLSSTLRIEKRLTFRPTGDRWSTWIQGTFNGVLVEAAADGILFDSLRFGGSPETDALKVEGDVTLRDCSIELCRRPVLDDFWTPHQPTLRLEGVLVSYNANGLSATRLEAKDTAFLNNGGSSGGYIVHLDNCRIENNSGDGLVVANGSIRNCTVRSNGGLGLRCDPDPGTLVISGSLFYANGGGGIYLGEQLTATLENCTFTRHTGPPAVIIDQALSVAFRHCTVVDNVFISFVDPGNWPLERYGGAFAAANGTVPSLQNCVIADNPTDESFYASGIQGPWIDGGGNVIGGPARLGVLRNNGGPNLSLLPLDGSPAIDAGVPSDLVRDTRGLSRQAGIAPDAGAVESGALALADTDADGIPDLWEVYRRLNPSDAADAQSDLDGDGQSAIAEYQSRTDPTDPASVHRIVGRLSPPRPQQSGLHIGEIAWNWSPGVVYELQVSTDLQTWRPVAEPYFIYGDDTGRNYMYSDIWATADVGLYRVLVRTVASP